MAVVSDIEIRLRADIARLQQDMDRVRREVSNTMSHVQRATDLAGKALKGLGSYLAVDAILSFSKAVIDSIDVVSDLSQRTGVAIEEIAGLQLWFQIGGAEAGDFESSMIKLSKQIIEGEKAFKSIGVATRNADGSLRSNVQVLLDSGDAFAKMENSTAKTAKALELFGKSGAVLLPILNSGSEGLRQMNEMADKLGLTFDQKTVDAVGNFNDTLDFLGLASQGVARQVAKELLPTLNSLVGQFLEFIVKGDGVRKTANTISIAMKVLYTAGVAVWQAFNTLGKMFGGMLALLNNGFTSFIKQIKLVIAGDFTGAWNEAVRNTKQTGQTFTDVYGGIASDAAAAFNSVSEVWNDAGGEMAAALAAASKGGKALSEEEKKAAEARLKAYSDLKAAADKRVAETAREAAGLAPLTEAQKLVAELDARIAANRKAFTPIEEAYLRARYSEIEANMAAVESQKAYVKMQEDSGKLEKEMLDLRNDAIKSATQEAEKNEDLVRTFGMTEAAIAALEVARLKEQLAQRSSLGLTLDEIEHLETLITLKERSAKAVADRDELEQTKQFWEDIEKTAHDTFVSIADDGKNAFQRLKDTAKNVFFDWLYQMTLKKWIINIQANVSGGQLGSLIQTVSGSGSSNSGNMGLISTIKSGYGLLSNGFSSISSSLGQGLSYIGDALGSNSTFSFGQGLQGFSSGGTGSGVSAGASSAGSAAAPYINAAGAAVIGNTLGKALSNGFSAFGGSGNSAVNTGTAIGAAVGSIVPVIGTAIGAFAGGLIGGAANRAFGYKEAEVIEATLQGVLNSNGFSGSYSQLTRQKGGWFRSDKWDTVQSGVDKDLAEFLSDTYQSLKDETSKFAEVLGVSANVIASHSSTLNIKLSKDQAETEKAISDYFAGVADSLAESIVPSLSKFKVEGEASVTTLQRLTTNFQIVDAVLVTFGVTSEQVFRAVGVASIEARERLIALSGGVDALAAQTQFYADNFLSRAEQVAPLQRTVNDQLAALGYASVKTSDQFKLAVNQLISSGALATEEGAKTYSALMALAPGFKTVTDYLNEIKEASKEFASTRLDSLSRAVDAQKDIVTKAYQSAMTELETQIDGVNDSISRTQELSEALKGAIGTVSSPTQAYAARQAAQAQIATALAIAKASGVLPSTDDLRDALSSLSRDSSDQFSTLADYQREVARTNNQLIELGGLTDDQLSVAERQLRALQDQKELARTTSENELLRLDSLVSFQQRQLNALTGVDDRVYSVAEAVRRVEEALDALRYAPPGVSVGLPTSVVNPNPNLAQPSVPVVSMPQQYGTMGGSAAAMAQQTAINDRFANMEKAMNRTASAVTQLATQFDQVSAGGQALGTVPL